MRNEVRTRYANWQHHMVKGVVLHSWHGAETVSVRGLAETARDRNSLVSFQSPRTVGYVILRVGAGPLLVPAARFELLTSTVIMSGSSKHHLGLKETLARAGFEPLILVPQRPFVSPET
jgi:hypothetical protein